MVTKASNSVLDLVNPPIDEMVLHSGTFDNVVIGSNVPGPITCTQIAVTDIASPLVGAINGELTQIFLGAGLTMTGNVLSVVFSPTPPVSPAPISNAVLREDGSYLLREDGSKILREHEGP
jgi:hypothetical protein